jgi:hypothetical protein
MWKWKCRERKRGWAGREGVYIGIGRALGMEDGGWRMEDRWRIDGGRMESGGWNVMCRYDTY